MRPDVTREVRSVVLAPFFGLEAVNNRPRTLAAALARFGPVDVVTTSFEHARKAERGPQEWATVRRIVQLPTPAYRANVSVARFRSHITFARAALRYIRARRPEYDVVYATTPLNLLAAGAFAAAPHALRILDVVDVWPDVLPFPAAARRLGWPVFAAWKRLFAQACRRADVLIAVSDEFLREGRRWFRGPESATRRFYPGDAVLPTGGARPSPGPRRIAYVGNVGHLYDFEPLLDVLSRPAQRGRWALDVVGRGDRDDWLRGELTRRDIPHTHHGVVSDPARLGAILGACAVGFNGYRNTTASFSYKATTYLAAGLPLLNSMEGDLGALVHARGLGANYRGGDPDSLARGLEDLAAANPDVLGARCRYFFRTELDVATIADQVHAFLASQLAARFAARSHLA